MGGPENAIVGLSQEQKSGRLEGLKRPEPEPGLCTYGGTVQPSRPRHLSVLKTPFCYLHSWFILNSDSEGPGAVPSTAVLVFRLDKLL